MSNPTIGVLGGGQLGLMLLEAAEKLKVKVVILDAKGSPAMRIAKHKVIGSFMDPEDVRKLARECDILTVEIEHVNTQILEELAEKGIDGRKIEVQPHWRTLRIIQDKYLQKQKLQEFDIPTAHSIAIDSPTTRQLEFIGAIFGYPYMLKSRMLAYDGRGNFPVKSPGDIPAALKALRDKSLYAEKWAAFRAELAVMVVKTEDEVSLVPNTCTIAYPTVETVHEDSICKLVYAPARNISKDILQKASRLARKTIAAFEGRGIFGVEMFLLQDDELLVNEIAPRPHNSGHYTIEACPISQYSAHLKSLRRDSFEPLMSIADSNRIPSNFAIHPLGSNAIMLNILGGTQPDSHLEIAKVAENTRGASVHMYGKSEARPGRKMGHVTVMADTMRDAEQRMEPLIRAVDFIRMESKNSGSDIGASDRINRLTVSSKRASTAENVLVAVTMGSHSDLPVLKPGLEILEKLEIPFEVNITSAHRTPEVMMEFAKMAAPRGIKVIIAAAGGAAHLPGMVAALTPLPVIGVPVKTSTLDGVDSLYSIVQMPRGVPVATVAINNSVNAALLAIQILGSADPVIQQRVQDYRSKMEQEVKNNARNLGKEGWREFTVEK